ncbi:thioredoxin domain-containing protein 11 isoform X2 [Daktulosphaira vitifoliae]|uniref:thioredoxin domain-containing protein 11 isoform X2 n=1 Tax=Daktulosphaira vitifoliae TaxID=58002 RepID=UPI0021AAD4AE|nr:thioredoxin domain-containing protein 11 isoform X2 [Daktulosphaira vitifoliae]
MKSVVEEEFNNKKLPNKNTQAVKNSQIKMFSKRLGKEIICLFIILCTTYATLINLKNDNTNKGPSPKPFFHSNSCVEDYYDGDLKAALDKAFQVDLAVIMFYAPWDVDSIESREAFEEACIINNDEVYFAAVNCWQPDSICNKILKGNKIYPMIVAYDYTKSGVPYSGPSDDAAYLTRFIDLMKRPVILLKNKLDLVKVHRKFHNVLVTLVDFKTSDGWDLYSIVLGAAINNLKSDPLQMYVKWCIAIWPMNDNESIIKLHLWNRTLAYNHSIINQEKLERWVLQETKLTSRWVPSPGRSRSQLLEETFNYGPTMLLFTPQNPYLDMHPTYSMFQALSIEYFNCGKNNIQGHYITKYIKKQLKFFFEERPKYVKQCFQMLKKKNPSKLMNLQKILNNTFENYRNYNAPEVTLKPENNIFNEAFCEVTQSFFSNRAKSFCSFNGDKRITIQKKQQPSLNYESTDQFINYWNENECYRSLLAEKYFKFSEPQYKTNVKEANVFGLACTANKTMTFIALDSKRFHHVAKGFGINLNQFRENTALLMYDKKNEIAHVLPKETHITKETMAKFLLDFLENRSKRHLKFSSDPELNIHSYNSKSTVKDSICIETLNSRNFNDAVFNSTENVVVYFYTSYCAYCQVVAHVLLTVAHLMRNVKDLKFFRFNGGNNDLSWYLTVDAYPTIIIFPAKKKSDSHIFPRESELTSKNLSQFILSNLSIETRLQAMVGLCRMWDSSENYSKHVHYCLKDIKLACDANISQALQAYRRGLVYRQQNKNVNLTRIFNRLRYLKLFSLVLDVTHNLNYKSMSKFGEIYDLYLTQS